MVIGTLGLIAGIILLIQGDWVIGLAGSIGSGGFLYKSYRDSKKMQEKEELE